MNNFQNCDSYISYLFLVQIHINGKQLGIEILQIIFVDVTGNERFELRLT
jgi:hypothetical protein